MKKFLSAFILIALVGGGCSTDDEPSVDAEVPDQAGFDRTAILTNWADNIVVPAYQHYASSLQTLQSATTAFTEAPDVARLEALRVSWLDAYLAWQSVEVFEIGPAEAVALRNATNIFPTNAAEIEQNIANEDYTLDLPSKIDEQGFPALDYLLYGVDDTDEAVVARYADDELGAAYRTYLTEVVTRLVVLTNQVVEEWNTLYRDTFVSNTGTSATGSFNKLANDYLFYYEKALRAGKVGIPAGVFSGQPLPETVEGRYAGDVSKQLLLRSLSATQDLFNGKHFAGEAEGESFRSYLVYLNTLKDGEDLGARINGQFNDARAAAESLDSNFATQIDTNNEALLTTYDQLQRNVILLKVDMFQALNVKVDFVDNDGD